MKNKIGSEIKQRKEANDKIYTPLPVALKMIEMCELKEGDTVLDPSYGGGVFFDNFPEFVNKDYCEIENDKDFFDYNKNVSCIIGNPPYSLWDKWLEHTMKTTNKFCYIFGVLNFTFPRIKKILDNGYGITKFHLIAIEYYFSGSYLVVFEKNKPSIITVPEKRFYCDKCNSKCNRGKKGYSFNECSKVM